MAVLIDNRQNLLPIRTETIHQEARAILNASGNPDGELSILKDLFNARTADRLFIDGLMHNFAIEWISLTRGPEGSALFTRDDVFLADREEQTDVVDTVGAGDAYAAILAAGYLLGWEPSRILRRATRFAGALCRLPGAIPEDPDFYQPFLGWMNDGGER